MKILPEIKLQVALRLLKTEETKLINASKFQSLFVQRITKKAEGLDEILLEQPVGVVVVDIESQNLNKDDVIYSYPKKCVLSTCRGAFVTLFHLLSEIKTNDSCQRYVMSVYYYT